MSISTHKMLADAGVENNSQAAHKDKLTNARHFYKMDEGGSATQIEDDIGGIIYTEVGSPDFEIGVESAATYTVSCGQKDNDIAPANVIDPHTGAGATYAPGAKEVVLVAMSRSVYDPQGTDSPAGDPSPYGLQRGFGGMIVGGRQSTDNDTLTGAPNAQDGRLIVNHHDGFWTARGATGKIYETDIRTVLQDDGSNWYDSFHAPEVGVDTISCVVKRATYMEFYRDGERISRSYDVNEVLDADALSSWNNWIPDTGVMRPLVHTEWRARPYWTGADCQSSGVNSWETLGLVFPHSAADFPRPDGLNFAFSSGNTSNICQSVAGERTTGEYPQNFYGCLMMTFENGAPDKQEIINGINYLKEQWLLGNKTLYMGWAAK